MSVSGTFESRFEKKYRKTDNGCWLWLLSTCSGTGYGQLTRDYKNLLAHRVAYELYVGPIPEGLYVLHKCDNRICVNPEHLWLGTHIDNMEDMRNKNRAAKGQRVASAVLTEDQVRFIREHYKGHSRTYGEKALAKRFGVGKSAIYDVVRGKQWRHVK